MDCMLFTFENEFRSCARGRQWCGIFPYHLWTASIKPILLFSNACYASWGLPIFSVKFYITIIAAYAIRDFHKTWIHGGERHYLNVFSVYQLSIKRHCHVCSLLHLRTSHFPMARLWTSWRWYSITHIPLDNET